MPGRLIGGYRPGTDSDLDMAVVQVPIVYENLKQTPSDPSCPDAFGELASAMKAATFANEPNDGSQAVGQVSGMR